MGRRPYLTPEQKAASAIRRRAYKTAHQKMTRSLKNVRSAPRRPGCNRERVSIDEVRRESIVNGGTPISRRFIHEHAAAPTRSRVPDVVIRANVEEGQILVGTSFSPHTIGARLEGNVKRRVNKEIKAGLLASADPSQTDSIVWTQMSILGAKSLEMSQATLVVNGDADDVTDDEIECSLTFEDALKLTAKPT